MTQRTIGALFVACWLLCGVPLLNGATVRIPPSRPGAIRVQAAGVSTGTGVDTATYPSRVDLAVELMAAAAADPWPDSGPNGFDVHRGATGAPLQTPVTSNGSTSIPLSTAYYPWSIIATTSIVPSGSDCFVQIVANDTGAARDTVLLCETTGGSSLYLVQWPGNQIYVKRGTTYPVGAFSYMAGGPRSFIAAFDGTTGSASVYLDGVLQCNVTAGTVAVGSSRLFSYNDSATSNTWIGNMWSLRIYSRLPTSDEVQAPAAFWMRASR